MIASSFRRTLRLPAGRSIGDARNWRFAHQGPRWPPGELRLAHYVPQLLRGTAGTLNREVGQVAVLRNRLRTAQQSRQARSLSLEQLSRATFSALIKFDD